MAKDIDELEGYESLDDVIEMEDENGNVAYYGIDYIIPLTKNNFAVLSKVIRNEKGEFVDADESDVIVSRIEFDEKGEEVYVAPTDEEFQEVCKIVEEWEAAEDEED